MVLEILGHWLASVETLFDLGVNNVAANNHRARERKPGLHRVLGQLGTNGIHWLVQVDVDNVAAEVDIGDIGHKACRVGFELLEEEPFARDLGLGLAVC